VECVSQGATASRKWRGRGARFTIGFTRWKAGGVYMAAQGGTALSSIGIRGSATFVGSDALPEWDTYACHFPQLRSRSPSSVSGVLQTSERMRLGSPPAGRDYSHRFNCHGGPLTAPKFRVSVQSRASGSDFNTASLQLLSWPTDLGKGEWGLLRPEYRTLPRTGFAQRAGTRYTLARWAPEAGKSGALAKLGAELRRDKDRPFLGIQSRSPPRGREKKKKTWLTRGPPSGLPLGVEECVPANWLTSGKGGVLLNRTNSTRSASVIDLP